MIRSTLFRAAAALAISAGALEAQTTLGSYTFNDAQFGNTLTTNASGLSHLSTNWLNTVNVNPGSPGALTGVGFNTGIANIGLNGAISYTIGYNTPIVNGSGDDLGVVVARFSSDPFDIAFSLDGLTFGSTYTIGAGSAVATGESRSFFYNGDGTFSAGLFVHGLDLGAFGIANGAAVQAVRITGSTELDLIRAAGLNATTTVPEPGTYALVALGLGALFGVRRRRA